jgi:hypothetical protein
MPDWSQTFTAEYNYAKGWISKSSGFDKSAQSLATGLSNLMSVDGFDSGEARQLSKLRSAVKKSGGKTVTEDHGILSMVGAWTDNAAGSVADGPKMTAAALKLLRHTYLLNRWSNKKVWIVSLPKSFQGWPSDELNAKAGTQIAARILLRDTNEHFSTEQKKLLANSTQQSMAWCQKALMVLSDAAKATNKGGGKSQKAFDKVKRWFAHPGASDADVNGYIATLSAGFKKMVSMLGKGQFILTDWAPLRGATAEAEVSFLNSEAFTFASNGEGLDVVYIEQSFFTDHPGNVLKGQKNWTRIVVHELTHIAAGTQDVVNGKSRYAWYGIGPHSGYPGSQCILNADNWAFFAGDCAGALVKSERDVALKII